MPDTPPTDTLQRLAQALGPKYEVRRLVGRGGFAEVYEVWDQALERRLAVKVLRPDIAWTAGTLERFKQETRAVAQLAHPNILAIHFVGEGDEIVYYAMPFVEGLSLGDLLRRSGALPHERALAIGEPILDALQHAHEAGLLHRDIKPDNIMLDATRGRPLLVDFGIARRLDADGGLTQAGLVVGTPHYMSPEQALGDRNLDARSDLYAMGGVLFAMVTGGPPFDGETSQEIVGKHIAEPPPAPHDVEPNVPRWLSDIIVHCLEKKPADRFASAHDVLEAIAAGRGPGKKPTRAVSAQRVIEGIGSNAKTEVVESGARRSAATRPPAATARVRSAGGAPRARIVGRVITAVVALAALAAAAVWFTGPRLVLQNQLVVPVSLTAGANRYVVEAGQQVSARVPRGRALTAIWTLVHPTGPDGAPLGIPVADTVAVANPRGRMRLTASARSGGQAFFAPLITNTTDRPLRVIVNWHLAGAMACPCSVPPGAVRMPIGYYPLFANSTVRVEDVQGRGAAFQNLGPQVDPASGVVRLEFRVGDLR